MPEHPTSVSESSLLRSPIASQGEGGALAEEEARKRGNTIGIRDNALDIAKLNGLPVSRVADNLMPTPNTMDHLPARTPEQKAVNKGKGGYSNVRETVVNDLMPTPTARDYKDGTAERERDGVVQTDSVARAIFNSGEVSSTNWGKFEPAIRRWEEVLGRPSPAPTKPDGKDGAHRLSSAFTEWMMCVPEGWITDCGLSRNDELKACGNGVVPQQAELALRVLLAGQEIRSGGGK
jgi:DNA (cytosine-5)-methyltransferase 1